MDVATNIWGLPKDIDIKSLLLQLENHFQTTRYQVVCQPEDDSRSVRLALPNTSGPELYIYCYGQRADHYGVHIEYPYLSDTNYSDTLEIHENISFDQLANIISINLCS